VVYYTTTIVCTHRIDPILKQKTSLVRDLLLNFHSCNVLMLDSSLL
jgi:hypothetical protein